MGHFFSKMRDTIYYFFARRRNRYSCSLLDAKNINVDGQSAKFVYSALTIRNVREVAPRVIFDDPLLIEQFHPEDSLKIGFISAAEFLLRDATSLDDAKKRYQAISERMFS